MSTLVISDLHLSSHFEQAKFEYLNGLIGRYSKVIINGDLWSIYSDTWEDFQESKWIDLILNLTKKDYSYIVGNHDPFFMQSESCHLYSKIQNEITIENQKQSFFVTHGDNLYSPGFRSNYLAPFNRRTGIDNKIRYPLESYASRLKPISSVKSSVLKRKNRSIPHKIDRKGADYAVFGHTHQAEVSEDMRYINTGFIGYGYASYLVIHDESFELVEENY